MVVLPWKGQAAEEGGEQNNYIVIYQTTEYNSKIGDSVEHLFQEMLKPQDGLLMLSPIRPYRFSQQTRQSQPVKTLISRTKDVLKKDTSLHSADYRSIQNSMLQIVQQVAEFMGTSTGSGMASPAGGANELKRLMTQYRQTIENYRERRKLKGNLFVQLAGMLKNLKGRNHIYVIYQKTFRIIPDKDTMDALRANPENSFLANEAFIQESTKDYMDTEKVSSTLKDGGIILNLIYVNTQPRRRQGIEYNELSGDVYNSLSKIVEATGGKVITTTKPAAAFKKLAGVK
jgi:hypothetical protein